MATFGIYGLMTIGFVIVNQHCGFKERGAVMGINCLFGAIAILVIAQLGGVAFDEISTTSPFIASAFLSLVMLFVGLIPTVRNNLDNVKGHH
jgi:MFS family permease